TEREAEFAGVVQRAAMVEVLGLVRDELRAAADETSHRPAVSARMDRLVEQAAATTDATRLDGRQDEFVREIRNGLPAVLSSDLLRSLLTARWLLDQAERTTPDLGRRAWQEQEQARQRAAEAQPKKQRWWTPGTGHGFGFGTPRSLTGVDAVYNGLVPELV